MKKLTLIIFIIISTVRLSAISISEANELYKEQKYEQARDIYLQLVQKDVKNSKLFFNLGNTYFKLQKYGKARLYYEKARKLSPNDKDILYNIQFIKQYLTDKVPEEEDSFILKVLKKINNFFGINLVLWVILGLFIILSVQLIFLILCRREKDVQLQKFLLSITAVIFMFSLFYGIVKLSYFQKNEFGVIISDTIDGYSGPGTDYKKTFTIHEGLKVSIEEEQDNWYLIKLPNGIGGWIEKSHLGKI
ncbi:MAG: hypothetical protein DRH57_01020 [Candidatus Cloacimonadota bacterium]|nr:MAG: hypothetical protein DRH57_01020 [Candidatus Cloacimonadota bacterium]